MSEHNVCHGFDDERVSLGKTRQEQLWNLHEKYASHFNHFWRFFKQAPVPILIKTINPEAKGLYKKRITDVAWDVHCIADEKWQYYGTNRPILKLNPFESFTFHTGIQVATPDNYGFLFRDRSGIGVGDVIHTAGVIEGTYRGEWRVHLINLSKEPKVFEHRDRIVQAVLTPIIPAETYDTDHLPETDRGNKGFGSSGK